MKDVDHFLASVHHNAATDGENKKWVSSSCTTTYTDDTAVTLGFRGTYHKITRGSTNNISIEP